MDYEILYRPSFSLAVVKLSAAESIKAEAGAMVSMSGGIQIQTQVQGGIFGGLKRTLLGGESLFINTFTATEAGEVSFAPALPGDVVHHDLGGEAIYLQSGSYIASSPDISVDTRWSGAKGFFSGEGLFLLRVSGRGHLFMSSYGAIHEVTLTPGQTYTVDTSHMVAFEETVQYTVRRAGGWKTTLLSGEGLVVEFTGPGKVYLQTRSPDSFVSWLAPKLPTRRE